MFRTAITRTELSSDLANRVINNIIGEYYNSDVSFVSTLRALLPHRMGEDESLRFWISSSDYREDYVKNRDIGIVLDNVFDADIADSGTLYLHYMYSSQTDNLAVLECIKSNFESRYNGWHRVEKFTDFFIKKFYSLAYINPEIKSAVIFIDGLDTRKYHYLQCAIPAILPWYFNPENGLTEDERLLIETLRRTSSDDYIECIKKFASQYDFRSEHIRVLLKNFESDQEERRKSVIIDEIDNLTRSITSHNDEIGRLLGLRHEKNIILLGLIEKINQSSGGDSEIMTFFLNSPNVELLSIENGQINFAAKDYLEYYNPEMAEIVINKAGSYIYDYADDSFSRDDVKLLMTAIFIDQSIKLRFCAAYKLDIRGGVRAWSGYDFRNSNGDFDGYMPNTHIQEYSCMGDYSRPVNQFLERFEYVGAIQQCVASCKNLNFGDTTVMSRFMRRLFESNENRCLELPDGSVVNPRDAIVWIKSQEQEETTNE